MEAIAIFRGYFRDDLNHDELEMFENRMMELGTAMPGFIEVKEFKAEDGENMMLVTFESREHMKAWRDHTEHKKVQQHGREDFFSEYNVKVCSILNNYTFKDGKREQFKKD